MSVSLLFFRPSLHVGTQRLPLHAPPTQSVPIEQAFPVAQRGHIAPPQSVFVSDPFFTASPQPAGAHLLLSGSHTRLVQSPSTLHSTHVEAAEHSFPPSIVHADPVAFGVELATPIEQASSVHSLLSSGLSLSSAIDLVEPAPSHTAFRQSFGVWAARSVPSAAKS